MSEKVQYPREFGGGGEKKRSSFCKKSELCGFYSVPLTYSIHQLYKVFLTQKCIFTNTEKNVPEVQTTFTLGKGDANAM